MKKIIIMLAVILMTTSGIFAQEDAAAVVEEEAVEKSGLTMFVGPNIGYGSLSYAMSNDDVEDWEMTSTLPILTIGGFFDANYVRVGVDYMMSAGDGTAEFDGREEDITSTFSFLNISALGKYPVDFGTAKVWGGIGIMYSMNLSIEDEDGEDITSEDQAIDDFYVIAGIGADIAAGPVFICPAVNFGYNLTPNTQEDDIDDITFSGMLWSVSIGVGIKI